MGGLQNVTIDRALLSLLSEKFVVKPLQTGVWLEDQAFDFRAAVVLFAELGANLPAVIRGDNEIAGAVQI